MRKLFSGVLLGAALILSGPAANALPATGEIILALGTLTPVRVPGSGTGDPTIPTISANFFLGGGSSPVTGNAPITQIFFSIGGNSPGDFGPNLPVFSGTLQARGFGIGAALAGAGLANVGFASGATTIHSAASATVSAHFGQWGTAAAVTRTHTGGSAACVAGGATCPTGALTSNAANVAFFGNAAQIVLVAPIDLWSSLAGGIPTFVIAGLNYVPEPGQMMLFLSGGGAMLALGLRRVRRQ